MSDRPSNPPDRPLEARGGANARTRRLLVGGLGAAVALIAAALVATQLLRPHTSGHQASAPDATRTTVAATATAGAPAPTNTPAARATATATTRAGALSPTAPPRRTATAPPRRTATTTPRRTATATPRRVETRLPGTARSTSVPVARSTPAGIKTVPLTAVPSVPTIARTPGAGGTPTAGAATAPARAVSPRSATPVPAATTGGTGTTLPAHPTRTPRGATPTRAAVSTPTRAAVSTPTPTTAVTNPPAATATNPPAARATRRPVVVPPPPPVHASLAAVYRGYKVGAYYFSGWSHGQNDNISAILTGAHPGAEPLIGWYDDSQAQVDKSVGQAADAGIDFLSFDWYDTPYSPYATDRTLNEGLRYYLTSSQRHRVGFNLVFVDHAPFVPTPDHPGPIAAWRTTEWPRIVDQWLPLFKQPDYVRVDGKPLLIVFSPEHMREICGGSAGVRAALDDLRGRARAAGLPGVTVAVAATVAAHSNPFKVQMLNVEGYDAATGYNYHSLGNEQYRVPVPYSQLMDENEATWNRVASSVHVPYMPVITSGWDQRYSAREQQTAIIYAGRTPSQFACYAVRARHWIDTHPTQTTGERIVMIFAWNEIGEGGAIIPNHQDGNAYARTVGAIFGTSTSPPTTPPSCHT